jgi:hypothetical protein
MKLAGILTTAIGGGVGIAVLATGSVMNTCAGSFGDSKVRCRRNAERMMRTGAVLTAVSAAVGVPLIVVGVSKNRRWERERAVTASAAAADWTLGPASFATYELPLIRLVF